MEVVSGGFFDSIGRRRLPPEVRWAAAALGLPEESLVAAGGASGLTWACGECILRTGDAKTLRREVVAMTAASRAVPVPEVLDAVEFTDAEGRARAGLLLAQLPGRPALDLTRLSVTQARQRGERCGSLHVALAGVAAPPGVDAVPAIPQSSETTTLHCLLHLDLHPLNVLIDETGDVSGVLDWANTAAGPAVLDRARSWSILTLDPAATPLHDEPHFAAMLQGWSHTADFEHLPAAARAWACQVMLRDLNPRYPAHRLVHVRQRLADLQNSRD